MLFLAALLSCAPPVVAHDLDVTLSPDRGALSVVDVLTLPADADTVEFVLYAGLQVEVDGANVTVSELRGFDVGAQLVQVKRALAGPTLTVRYRGAIVHPPLQQAAEHQRAFQDSPGTIEARGVYLAGGALWFPQLVEGGERVHELLTARVRVRGLPQGWAALSEGDAAKDGRYTQVAPVDDLHLVAGPFTTQQTERIRGVDVLVWLRGKPEEDRPLAQRYLEATGQYLALYEELLGPYPYSKFALVENFWETGYGMPSFTLLGPQVVRFPFILRTSYPHELLHNWWGNGVFVDDAPAKGTLGGNWCEGLTAYLADHLMAEIEGRGAEYRRSALERYQDFVDGARDFPLTEFSERTSASSEAVGYGKGAMLFHMVRRRLGDERFVDALRRFYRHHRFDRASFDDLADAFAAQGGDALGDFVRGFVQRMGAPTLAWRQVRESVEPNGTRKLRVELVQTQPGEPFALEVPVVITTSDGRSIAATVVMHDKVASAEFPVPTSVARVDIDPFFDVFRTLDPDETPPALSRTLGAKRVVFVLPSLASAAEKQAWQRAAKALCGDSARCSSVVDNDADALPGDASIWVLGYGNTLRAVTTGAKAMDGSFDDRGFIPPGGTRADRTDPSRTSVALALPHPTNKRHGVVFLGAHKAEAIDALARKIPHYGKYGYVGFVGDGVDNSLKGQWSASQSPLTVFLRDARPPLALQSGPPLRKLPPALDPSRMVGLVQQLSAPAMEGRADGTPQQKRALQLVEEQLRAAGLVAVTLQPWGLEAMLPGRDAAQPAVVLGAHVDGLGKEGKAVFAGADDNASGVAVLVEVAHALHHAGPLLRPVRFVVFTGEEKGRIGSRAFVASLGDARAKVHSMVNLDTVGRHGTRPLLVLDGDSASEWVHIVRGVGFTTGVVATMAKEGGGASDQKSFTDAGIPAVQIFSGPHADYHKASDTFDKVEPASLVDAAVLAREMIAYLADRQDPLSATGASSSTGSAAVRKASLGIIPDMAFDGVGVRADGATPGSGADKAGMKAGDVLVRFDGRPVADLRGYSDLLKERKPGDRVKIVVKRGDKELTLDVELGAR